MANWIRRAITILVTLAWFGVAAADDAPTLSGRVTDLLGAPIANAKISVQATGAPTVEGTTDKDGRYTVALAKRGAYNVVIVSGHTRTYRQAVVGDKPATLDIELEEAGNGEVIRVYDPSLPRPVVMPKPSSATPQKSLPYSKQAMERDAWAVAWLLLDVDHQGDVTRLKMLKRPGFDLDEIAVEEAWKLKFDPARDSAGRAIRTLVVWKMEWPSWGWLVAGMGTTAGRPADTDEMYRFGGIDGGLKIESVGPRGVRSETRNPISSNPLPVWPTMPLSRVPCADSGTPLNLELHNRAYRDCSRPDLRNINALPWITRANAKTVLEALAAATPPPVRRAPRSRVPELVATGVAAVFGAGLVVSVVEYNKYSDLVSKPFGADQVGAREQPKEAYARWQTRMFASAGAFVVSGAVAAFLWSRHQTRADFSVQPTSGGATLSFGRTF
jgi:hypothetical protein